MLLGMRSQMGCCEKLAGFFGQKLRDSGQIENRLS